MTEEVGTMAFISLPKPGGTGARHPIAAVRRKIRIPPFWQHLAEMVVAMTVGMAVGLPAYLAITGLSSYNQGLAEQPVGALLAMSLSMALPMAAWMLVRGHGRRNSAEMAAAMIVPAIPFMVLCGLNVIGAHNGRGYMPVSILAMIALMVYRRDSYSMPMQGLWHRQVREEHG